MISDNFRRYGKPGSRRWGYFLHTGSRPELVVEATTRDEKYVLTRVFPDGKRKRISRDISVRGSGRGNIDLVDKLLKTKLAQIVYLSPR